MKIAAYCRVSTEKEEQLDSLAHQKEFFLEYARKNGHELFHLYADEGISGTSLKKRTEFQRLMNDAQKGLFELVVVKDISRVARNTVDFLQSIRKLKTMGVNMIFITANMTSLGDSEFILTIFGAMAQEESSSLSKRVKWGKKINAKKGRVPQRIYGYDRIDNYTLQINQEEAGVVKRIFDLYLKGGLGCRGISLALNADGAKTKFGCEWDPRGVRRILQNPIYCGHYVNNKYEIEDYLTGRQVRLPEREHFHHDRPEWAIIPEEDFRRAQLQMEDRRKRYQTHEGPFTGTRYSTRHVFSTLIRCEHCGRAFTRKTYTYVKTRVYWLCSTNSQFTAKQCGNLVKLEEEELLAHIRDYFSSLIQEKDVFVRQVLAEVKKQCARQENAFDAEAMEVKRKKLIARRRRYQEMYANDVMTMAELKGKTAAVEEELETLDFTLKQYKQSQTAQQKNEDAIDRCIREIERFLSLETVTNLDMRRMIDRISVNMDGTVRIILKKLEDGPPL